MGATAAAPASVLAAAADEGGEEPTAVQGPALETGMDVFGVHRALVKDYRSFTKGGTVISDDRIADFVEKNLDALFFHLHGVSRKDVEYIANAFPIVRRKDEAKYGTYRTKELILTEYDRMTAAGLTLENPLVDGENYTSTLTPPPGHGPCHPA